MDYIELKECASGAVQFVVRVNQTEYEMIQEAKRELEVVGDDWTVKFIRMGDGAFGDVAFIVSSRGLFDVKLDRYIL